MPKFNEEIYKDIYKRWKANESMASIARSYGVKTETIRQKIRRYERFLKSTRERPEINQLGLGHKTLCHP